jgi:ornithine cyclodeaminase/alanine dehydrogenase
VSGKVETKLFSQEDIKQVITMKDVVEIVDKTFKGFGEGTTINPTKVNLDLGETAPYPPYQGFMNAMPAYVGWLDTAGIKWAGGFLGERKKLGFPYITSLILLIDPKVGHFRAVMDGELITNLRTGAQTAVALKYMFDKKSIRVGLFGAGMQGHTQTMAIAEVFDIEELRVYDINREASLKFAENMKDTVKGEIKIVDTPEEAAKGDAVVCVTQSKEKFVKDEWIKPGMVLFPMGSYQECEDAFILNADKIIVDHIGQTLHRGALAELNEAGRITEENIYATIGELAAGLKPGRIGKDERYLCIPIGTGAMDIAVATVAYQKAAEKGLGGKFAFV